MRDVTTTKPTSKRPSNKLLPAVLHERGTWRQHLIPTLYRWAGIQPNPFAISDKDLIGALNIMMEAFYGDMFEDTITTSHIVFRLVRDNYHLTFHYLQSNNRQINVCVNGGTGSDPLRSPFPIPSTTHMQLITTQTYYVKSLQHTPWISNVSYIAKQRETIGPYVSYTSITQCILSSYILEIPRTFRRPFSCTDVRHSFPSH